MMTQAEWVTLAQFDGPVDVWAFDVSNESDQPVKLEIVRDSGKVIMSRLVSPYHAAARPPLTPTDTPSIWLWHALSWESPITVPDGQSVNIRTPTPSKITDVCVSTDKGYFTVKYPPNHG